jgi:fructan beta-fructosidase
VAFFTYHNIEGEKVGRTDFQTQGMAYSLDNGETWTKYDRNPVIPNNGKIKDFRDPKVFWHEESKRWIMALVAGDHVKFYSSRNLRNWYPTGEFGKDKGAHGGVWECPDLFKLKIEGEEEDKWVLLISINPGAPNGGSGTQYFIGDFDGRTFTSEGNEINWLDYGRDNYAGVTYNNVPNDERIFIGWMSNWNYARDTPTERWRSAMTLPRKLTLNRMIDSSLVLKNYPIKQFENQLEDHKRIHKLVDTESFSLEHHDLSTSEIGFQVNLKDDYTVYLKNNKNEEYVFQMNPSAQQLATDRRKSGIVDFEKSFANSIHKQKYQVSDTLVEVRMIVDRSSVEIFVDNGRYVFTDQVFPSEPYSKVEIVSKSAPFYKDIRVLLVNSIWQKDE